MYTEDEKKPHRTIKIQKRSTVSAPADITVVNADISGVNATFEGAMKALARCTKQVRDAIQKAGIPREDLRSSQLSIEQNYREEKIGEDKHGNDKFRRVPDGFLYRQNIKFEFPNDNDKLSAAIENIMATDVEPKVVFYFKSSSE
ncbi:MAG: SIMPL domain-containing protein, partial [Candidatus Methanomethylophilaceae archaeon]|nr:SIMPL domain-containing protein [Candidatus Methanomethylophilaceae archaeon]